eukprot:gnl/Spiro4/6354_TR3276_c0_g1_i1.p1 gnl/Spiro4/6354_TR3276_c0_g1~~gnl/Spiro4/6354_TR3276_c0_g1_i1.p1  ORF type:complete len:215 (+),score=44.58 gnl/Spiro4/6354_TR3276_c0_g1_i1:54-647(+)
MAGRQKWDFCPGQPELQFIPYVPPASQTSPPTAAQYGHGQRGGGENGRSATEPKELQFIPYVPPAIQQADTVSPIEYLICPPVCVLSPPLAGYAPRPFNTRQLCRLMRVRTDKLVAAQARLKKAEEVKESVVDLRAEIARRKRRRGTGQFVAVREQQQQQQQQHQQLQQSMPQNRNAQAAVPVDEVAPDVSAYLLDF